MRKRRNFQTNFVKQGEEDTNDLRVLFRKFVNIKISEGVSDGTSNQYEENFRFFCEYVDLMKDGDYGFDTITPDYIREWIRYMQFDHVQFRNDRHRRMEKEVGLAPSTINTRLKTLRVMFNTLSKERPIDNNPMASVRNIIEPVEDIVILSDREIRRLLNVMGKSYYTTYRDYVLTMLLLDTMMRISEAVRLERSDIDRDANVIKIRARIARREMFPFLIELSVYSTN